MTTRAIPKIHVELITLALVAARAAELHGDDIGLLQNTGLRVRHDLSAVTGEADSAVDLGAQYSLNRSRATMTTAQAIRREAMGEGRAFCAAAVDLLKIRFGRRWNVRWEGVGLLRRSLAIPHDPLATLVVLRNYFRAHSEHENAPLEITAERADTLASALQTASQNVLAGRTDWKIARRNRDGALQKLATRLRGLRSELDQLLAPDDPLWLVFGFSRPVDRRQPERVAEITVRPLAPGVVEVSWPPAARAEDYRLAWQREDATEPPTKLPLHAASSIVVTDLPIGVPLVFSITARNEAGESRPVRTRIVL